MAVGSVFFDSPGIGTYLELFTFCSTKYCTEKEKREEASQFFSKAPINSVTYDLSASAFCMLFLCFLILFCIETDNDDL